MSTPTGRVVGGVVVGAVLVGGSILALDWLHKHVGAGGSGGGNTAITTEHVVVPGKWTGQVIADTPTQLIFDRVGDIVVLTFPFQQIGPTGEASGSTAGITFVPDAGTIPASVMPAPDPLSLFTMQPMMWNIWSGWAQVGAMVSRDQNSVTLTPFVPADYAADGTITLFSTSITYSTAEHPPALSQ